MNNVRETDQFKEIKLGEKYCSKTFDYLRWH